MLLDSSHLMVVLTIVRVLSFDGICQPQRPTFTVTLDGHRPSQVLARPSFEITLILRLTGI